MKKYGLFSMVGLMMFFLTAATPLFFGVGALAGEADSPIVRVFFSDRQMANQLFRAFEGEMIETDYDAGFHIITGEPDALARLDALGLDYEIAQGYTPPLGMISLNPLLRTIPGYSCYETVEETYAAAQAMATANPTLASWTDVGDSWEKSAGLGGYDMMVLKLTNAAISGDKPKLFLTCAIHAREYTTAGLCLTFAQQLVDDYGVDADTTWVLDHHEVHLMLHANPDGRKKAETGISWRKNTNQNYCGATSNNRGADLNRNFDYNWGCCGGSSGSECDATYRGPYAGSEPEAQAVMNYMTSIFPDQREPGSTAAAPDDATGLYLDIHSYSELVLWPWGYTSDPAPNGTQMQTLGRKFAYWNGYTPQQAMSLYPTDGTTDGWGYGELGVPSYCFELGTSFFQSCSVYTSTILPGNLPALMYAAKVPRTPYMTPAGPNAYSLAVSADNVPTGTVVTLTATIDDTQFNNSNGTEGTQNIAAVEYYVDNPPWVTSPTPVAIAMSASDGSFNSTTEGATTAVDTTGWSDGQHILLVRGQDANGDWGAFSAVFLTVENISCVDNGDCDDGLFCNGAETCVNDICQPGADPCPGEHCDETTDQCVAGPVFEDDFESGNAQGWTLRGAGSTAGTGDWEVGDPAGTISGSDQAQPEDAYAGSGCIFTAQNSSLGVNDVDGGVIYLQSPAIDLGGMDSAALNYMRWFYNRDTGADSGDFFVAEVSDDNGANWVNLETLGSSQSANTWTAKTFDLQNFVTLTSTVVLRFGAADGSAAGNIIEAAIDNLEVWASGGCDVNADCDDGLFCNGAETCVDGSCQAGSDPCPGQSCDEVGDVCADCFVNADCDDGAYCNGAETCVGGSCQAGSAIDCDDSVACTADSCNETSDACDNIPDNAPCDDGVFCNGAETCDAGSGCLAGGDPCPGEYCDETGDACYECETTGDCDDGQWCNGAETCVGGACEPGADPCPGQTCDEANDECVAGPLFSDDFESGNVSGWNLYASDSTASTGDWLIGDPAGTVNGSDQAQPENAYAGSGCVFTAQNTSLGTDDVDGGVVYLESPALNLSGYATATFNFTRWFYNRDTGEDSGDFFVAEVSGDNGATWVNLETLGTNDSANTWTARTFQLQNFITLTGTVRVRFGAADGSSTGNIIEAAVDNVEVWVTGGCDTNQDCDDGLFCNGAETCAAGACQSGSDPCPGQSCNEAADECVAGPAFDDDFESGNAQGWDLYAPGSTASTGNWEAGDPAGTVSGSAQAQPEDAYAGSGCIFTAQNTSLGVNDVDGGVVYLRSPTIDLSGASTATLTFVRWFYNRDTGEDSGDFYVAEVSSDNGANWVDLETLGTNDSANTWTARSFDLQNYITLTSTVRLRFGASDGSSTGNIIEAAIDNLEVWAYTAGSK